MMLLQWKIIRKGILRIFSKYILLFIGICVTIVYLMQMKHLMSLIRQEKDHDLRTELLIDTPGCKIPKFQIVSAEIKQYIKPPDFRRCNIGNIRPLFDSNRTSIYIMESALTDYNIANHRDIQCCYQYFTRREPQNGERGETDRLIEFDKQCIGITKFVHVDPNKDFVKISCNDTCSRKMFYEDYFHFISNSKNANTNFSNKDQKNVETQDHHENDKINVLILGLDAVSRLNFHRQMPETALFLQTHSAVEFLGYNKIGDNSSPNLYAVLTGYNDRRLKDICSLNKTLYLDSCDFIWKEYKDAGYVTAFGEDMSKYSIFAYGKNKGFKRQATDYFYNQFDYLAERRIGYHRSKLTCLGSRPSYQICLKYMENFVYRMKEKRDKYFGFFWTSALTHTDVNNARVGDERISKLLRKFHDEGVFDDTAFLLMSDHGMSYGNIRNSYQGSFEDRLPLLNILLPEWYQKKHPEFVMNLKANAQRLTTPYDLHKTLGDLVHSRKVDNNKSGISLFREISSERTCADANIANHFCACKQTKRISVNDTDVVSVVHYVIYNHLNNMLLSYPECYELTLFQIIDARRIVNAGQENKYENKAVSDYMVTFETLPGRAIFEATVWKKKYNAFKTEYKVSGIVSRLNLLGTHSECITDNAVLKLYCYCKSN